MVGKTKISKAVGCGQKKKKKEGKEKILQEQSQMLGGNSTEHFRIVRTLGKTLERVLPQNWGKLPLDKHCSGPI